MSFFAPIGWLANGLSSMAVLLLCLAGTGRMSSATAGTWLVVSTSLRRAFSTLMTCWKQANGKNLQGTMQIWDCKGNLIFKNKQTNK